MAEEPAHQHPEKSPAAVEEAGAAPTTLPNTWMYKKHKVGPWTIPYYASPPIQLLIVSLVCFMCPGMFNALSGMGGSGQFDKKASDDANTALYSTFAVVGFFAGSFTNKVGLRWALSFGGIGYSIYIASFLVYSHKQNLGFTTFAGAFLGVCAGMLWTAQGALMMSYPPENSKGKYISWFWMIFNLGAVIGSLIPLGQNINQKAAATVTDGTYIGFLILTVIGAILAWTLVDASKVVREDGSHIILMKNPTWKTEFMGLWEVFRSDPYIIALFPMFFASNWFYGYQFNAVNAGRFNTRTRALNNTLYYIMQIVGAFVFGYGLDHESLRRTVRAKIAWVALFVLTFVIWGAGYPFQKQYVRAESEDKDWNGFYDWEDKGFIGGMFLYMFYGFYDAAFQTCVYWYMGSLSNNARKLANFAGFYKGIQSAGAAIMWAIDGHKVSYMAMFASCWGLLAGSLLVGLPVILWKIKDHVPIEEDIKFSNQTFEEVAATGQLEQQRKPSVGEKSEI